LAWTQEVGPTTALLAGVNTTTLAVQNLSAGTYIMRLSATDNEGASAFSETSISVVQNQMGPVVFAGNDTTIALPSNFIRLIGRAIPSTGFITSMVWTQVDGPPANLVGDSTSASAVVSVVDMVPGTYTFRLTATDNSGLSSSDDIVVTEVEGKSNPIGASIVFSPNGDANNDVWTIKNTAMIQSCPCAIYNSLGKKIYEANQYNNDWDGTTSNGLQAKEGDYYFVFDCSSKKKTYSGAFRIIR
jgi:gliding motility-associated-like protein